jgi:hypothetical protein
MPRAKPGTPTTAKVQTPIEIAPVPERVEIEVTLDQEQLHSVKIMPTASGLSVVCNWAEGYKDDQQKFRPVKRQRNVFVGEASLDAPWAALEAALWALIDAGSE